MKYGVVVILAWSSLFGEWLGPVDIFTASTVEAPVIGVDGSGDAVILATLSGGRGSDTEAARLQGGVVSPEESFLPVGTPISVNALSVNASGNAVAVWLERISSNIAVQSAVLIDGSWSSAVTISDAANFSVQTLVPPGVRLAASNNAISTWTSQEVSDSNFAIQGSRFSSSWQAIPDVFNSADFVTTSVLSGSPSGQALVVWCNNSSSLIQAAYYDGSIMGTPTTVSGDVFNTCVLSMAVSMNDQNHAIILWNDSLGGLSSSTFSNGSYGVAETVYASGGASVTECSISLDSSGNAIALWVTSDGITGDYNLMTNRYAQGAWGIPLVLDTATGGSFLQSINIQVDGQGNGYAVWEKDDASGAGSVYYSQYADGSWLGSPVLLSGVGVSTHEPNLSVNASGAAAVVWVIGGGPINDDQTAQVVYMGETAPLPVAGLTGKQVNNRFVLQSDLVNVLNWTASPDPLVVSYDIFRNGAQIATVLSTDPLTYQDHHRTPKQEDTYQITAVNGNGVQSDPLVITLP